MRCDDESLIDDYDGSGGIFRRDLPTPHEIGAGAVERTWRKNGQSKVDTGMYDMLVENRVMARLLGDLASCITGPQIYRRNSYLLDKLDQQIASDVFTVTDDPLMESGLASRLYDSDGIPSRKRVIIDAGVLETYLIDYFWSRKLKVEPTTGSMSNVIYSYGNRSLEEMVASLDRGILVTGFIGGNSNPTTGDFSYGVMGELIENGNVIQPVNEMNISGNYQELWMNLVELGNDPYTFSPNRCPSMLFREVQFAGA
jgi:PmbA protein